MKIEQATRGVAPHHGRTLGTLHVSSDYSNGGTYLNITSETMNLGGRCIGYVYHTQVGFDRARIFELRYDMNVRDAA